MSLKAVDRFANRVDMERRPLYDEVLSKMGAQGKVKPPSREGVEAVESFELGFLRDNMAGLDAMQESKEEVTRRRLATRGQAVDQGTSTGEVAAVAAGRPTADVGGGGGPTADVGGGGGVGSSRAIASAPACRFSGLRRALGMGGAASSSGAVALSGPTPAGRSRVADGVSGLVKHEEEVESGLYQESLEVAARDEMERQKRTAFLRGVKEELGASEPSESGDMHDMPRAHDGVTLMDTVVKGIGGLFGSVPDAEESEAAGGRPSMWFSQVKDAKSESGSGSGFARVREAMQATGMAAPVATGAYTGSSVASGSPARAVDPTKGYYGSSVASSLVSGARAVDPTKAYTGSSVASFRATP